MSDRGYYLEYKASRNTGVDAHNIAIKQQTEDRASWLNQ